MAGFVKRSFSPSFIGNVLFLGIILTFAENVQAQTMTATDIDGSGTYSTSIFIDPLASSPQSAKSTTPHQKTTTEGRASTAVSQQTTSSKPSTLASTSTSSSETTTNQSTSNSGDSRPEDTVASTESESTTASPGDSTAEKTNPTAGLTSTISSEETTMIGNGHTSTVSSKYETPKRSAQSNVSPSTNATNSDDAKTDPVKSKAVAGLCLAVIVLLLVAINVFLFFRSKMGLCSSRTGVLHILSMSVLKKDRVIEDDVEGTFKEKADIANKTEEQNGEVHVKVDVTDIAGSSNNKDNDKDAETDKENDDGKGAPAAHNDGSDKPDKSEQESDKSETKSDKPEKESDKAEEKSEKAKGESEKTEKENKKAEKEDDKSKENEKPEKDGDKSGESD